MSRASVRAQNEADRRCPVRVRIPVPPEGLGRQLALMHSWLDEICGTAGWATAPAGGAGVTSDAIAFYFADSACARAFVARFCCGYRAAIAGAFLAGGADAPPRRLAAALKTP